MMALVDVDGPVPVTKFVHKSDLKCKYFSHHNVQDFAIDFYTES